MALLCLVGSVDAWISRLSKHVAIIRLIANERLMVPVVRAFFLRLLCSQGSLRKMDGYQEFSLLLLSLLRFYFARTIRHNARGYIS